MGSAMFSQLPPSGVSSGMMPCWHSQTQLSHHFGSGGLKVAEFRHSAEGLLNCGAKSA
jgi:hypothetical protein